MVPSRQAEEAPSEVHPWPSQAHPWYEEHMTRRIHVFDAPDRFVADAIGQPGSRTFYLQASEGERHVTVALEKVQVALLAERLVDLLDAIRERGVELPPIDSGKDDTAPLDEPILESFRVGTIAMGWDVGRGCAMIETRAMVEDEEDPPEVEDDDPGMGRPRARVPRGAGRLRLHPSGGSGRGGRSAAPSRVRRAARPAGHLSRRNGYVH
jgi:uncharacterized repeat protein (TIGR03847 family)